MNIEKIKNYNQKMLAVFSTLIVLLVLVCILFFIVQLFSTKATYHGRPQGLMADEITETLNQDNLRRQIVSYEIPWLIDTLRRTYIIPLSVKTLKKAEDTNRHEAQNPVSDSYYSSKSNKGYYSRKDFEGKYANLLVYTPVEEKIIPLFNQRIMIGNIRTYYFKDDILLLFFAASEDTDKNGVIDLEDQRELCLYSMNTGLLKKITDGENQPESYKFIENSKDILVEFSLANYKKSQFDNYQLPHKIMKYDFDTGKLTDIIPENIREKMQKLVEGRE